MATKVIMPQLGESVVEGTVNTWLKKVGDHVEEYEALLEVSTDKVDSEIPAPAAGTVLEIYVPAGTTVGTGTILCLIGESGEKVSDPSDNGHQQPVVEQQDVTSRSVRLSPVVARMAAEHKLDVSQIAGTGRDGRVTKKDVETYLESRPQEDNLPPWERPGSGDLFKPSDDEEEAPA
ncbi:MAG: E3 binding domain-containing protein, partial [Anaerolineae bacterium]|nr:E3 binding domain-containing protein [Anaerolineae bacterium]